MPKIKQKNNRAARKRFKLLKSGKIKRMQQNRRHNTGKRPAKRQRHLRESVYVSKTQLDTIKTLIQA